MILFNYRLWVYDHHVLHHGRTNVKDNNFLSPLTLAEYRALSPFHRALYRAYHSHTGPRHPALLPARALAERALLPGRLAAAEVPRLGAGGYTALMTVLHRRAAERAGAGAVGAGRAASLAAVRVRLRAALHRSGSRPSR